MKRSDTETDEIVRRIKEAFVKHAARRAADADEIVDPARKLEGKLYETHVLSAVVEKLVTREGCAITLRNGTTPRLRLGHGAIDPKYTYFEIYRDGRPFGELWTDIQFRCLSYVRGGGARSMTPGDNHELDIVMTKPGVRGYPAPSDIMIAVECKDTGYKKRLLREILGIRRELSLLTAEPIDTGFRVWPRPALRADPPSCVLAFSTSSAITNFAAPSQFFGVDFVYDPM